MSSGFVYVLSNAAMPGLLKIGFTANNPELRAADLQGTGVPLPFRVEFAIYSPDARAVEHRVHESLSHFRISSSREFFKLTIEVAISEILCELELTSGAYTCAESSLFIDPGVANCCAKKFGGHPFEVADLLMLFTDEQWLEAKSKQRARRENYASRTAIARIE